jgi:anti-sigma factor RsiW
MECKELRGLADAYLDGELPPASRAELDAHLAGCAACRAEIEASRAFSAQIKQGASYFEAPAGLAASLTQVLGQAAGKPVVRAFPRQRRETFWRPMALAASFVLAMLFSGGVGYMTSLPAGGETITQEIVDSHVRSLLAGHLTDVTSTDQHTVKPWFNGHLDSAPPVKDFAAEGFPLIGGRLDYIDHRPVAAMVYRHGLHPINLFVWADPSATVGQPGASTRQGYNIRHWVQADMTYWLISDVEGEKLDNLETLLRKPE